MATTKISANVLASGAALTNINAGSTIDFTKNVSMSGNLTVDTNTLYVDSVNNRVGIGTATPASPLDVIGRVSFRNGSGGAGSGAYWDPTAYGNSGMIYTPYLWCNNISIASGSMTFGTGGSNTSNVILRANKISTITIQGTNNYVGIGTDSPSEKLTVVGNISASGNVTASNLVYNTGDQTIAGVKTFSNNIVGNGTANRLPNQAATTYDAILTRQTNLASTINYTWSNVGITATFETPSTALMTQNNSIITASYSWNAGSLTGYLQGFILNSLQLNYPNGSGEPNRFADPFTMFWEYDTNTTTGSAYPVNQWWTYGLAQATVPLSASHKCLAVKISHEFNTIEAQINAAGGTSVSSGAIALPSGFLDTANRKRKVCVVWTGTTLSVYLGFWPYTGYSTQPFTFVLGASATMASPPTTMDNKDCCFLFQLTNNWPNVWTGSESFSDVRFIRQAINPII